MIPWEDVAEWFDPAENGTLPDVIVPDTTIADWEALFALIRSEGWRCEYDYREERLPLPASAAEMLVPDPDGVRGLWIWPNPDLEWIVRPWSPDEIDGDVSLYEIQGQERLDVFCGFLRTVGAALGKSVLVYSEGTYDSRPPMMAYEPALDRVVFLADSWR